MILRWPFFVSLVNELYGLGKVLLVPRHCQGRIQFHKGCLFKVVDAVEVREATCLDEVNAGPGFDSIEEADRRKHNQGIFLPRKKLDSVNIWSLEWMLVTWSSKMVLVYEYPYLEQFAIA